MFSKKQIQSLSLFILLYCSLGQKIAISATLDLNITGKIVPGACAPLLPVSSTIDLGGISNLSETSVTNFDSKEFTFKITCPVATKIGLKITDNSPDSVAKGYGMPQGSRFFGLGKTTTGVKIGAYELRTTGLAEGYNDLYESLYLIESNSIKKNTENSFNQSYSHQHLSSIISTEGKKRHETPDTYATIAYILRAHVIIMSKKNLKMTGIPNLDGRSTFTLVYP